MGEKKQLSHLRPCQLHLVQRKVDLKALRESGPFFRDYFKYITDPDKK